MRSQNARVGININGCNLTTYSRLSKKCRKCMYKNDCKTKKLEAVAIMPIQAEISPSNRLGITAQAAAESFKRLNEVLKINT